MKYFDTYSKPDSIIREKISKDKILVEEGDHCAFWSQIATAGLNK